MPNHASSFLLDSLFHVTKTPLFCIEIGERCDWWEVSMSEYYTDDGKVSEQEQNCEGW
jgi:hypothetical protein